MSQQTFFQVKPFWKNLYNSGWQFGLLLVLLWSIPRFLIVLQASQTGNYQWVSLMFVSMWLAPFVFLTKEGRRQIGLKKPDRIGWLFLAVVVGMFCSALMFAIATALFGLTESNWFVYISQSYSNLPESLDANSRLTFFLIFSAINMTFSPIGEELFYRGIVHESFATDFGDKIASLLDSLAFSLVHLAHFGIIFTAAGWKFLPVPALLWVSLLFGTCLLFFYTRKKSGSILGAILAHAGFNLAMNYFIFYYIL